MAQFTIVGKKLSASEFRDYAAHVPLGAWRPDMIVLHNTAVPTLRDRSEGLTEVHIHDLLAYYADVQRWSGGPHLFVDQKGVWVFNPLDRPGVHSPSWNGRSWGVEMLGDYASEAFDSGPGLAVRTNTIDALAALYLRLGVMGIDEANFRLHKEDPKTTHDCPGRMVDKERVRAAVQALLASPASDGLPTKVVVYRRGGGQAPSAVVDATLRQGTLYADARALSGATGVATSASGAVAVRSFVEPRYSILWKAETERAYLVEA